MGSRYVKNAIVLLLTVLFLGCSLVAFRISSGVLAAVEAVVVLVSKTSYGCEMSALRYTVENRPKNEITNMYRDKKTPLWTLLLGNNATSSTLAQNLKVIY